MSTGVSAISSVPATRARLADYVELAKPRITILELVTVVAAMQLAVAATGGEWNAWAVAAMVVGTTLLAVSANTLNQCLEIRFDAMMTRTANRPLPAGRMRRADAVWFGIACVAIGTTIISFGVNAPTALLGLLCWFLYVAVYTPMKRVSPWNTFAGAVSGALPIVMGWTAGGGPLDLVAFGLFAVLFLWQYPHFMAIAWLCREDYAGAGYQMTTTVEPTGRRAGRHAIVGAALLLPAVLVPAIVSYHGAPVYATLAVLFALVQLAFAVAFFRNRNDQSARRLLRATLVFLPAWMLTLVLCLP